MYTVSDYSRFEVGNGRDYLSYTTPFLYSPFTYLVRPKSTNGKGDLCSGSDITHPTCD